MTPGFVDRAAVSDADIPSEVVGGLPSIDLARIRLQPLGWLFVAGAVFVAAERLRGIAGAPFEDIPAGVLAGVAAVILTLLPAALLRRSPGALRTHRLLLAGLAAWATFEVLLAVVFAWPLGPDGSSWRGTPLDGALPYLGPLGSVLIGGGLLQLRMKPPSRFGLLAATAGVYVALGIVPWAISVAASRPLGSGDPSVVVFSFVVEPLAAAFAVWAAVGAWLDREPPRAFWAVLALALPFGLAARAFEVPQLIAVAVYQTNTFFVATTTGMALIDAAVALLALAAYGRLMPITEDAG